MVTLLNITVRKRKRIGVMKIRINLRTKTMISKYINVTDERVECNNLYCSVVPHEDYDFNRFVTYAVQMVPVNELTDCPHITVVYSKKCPTKELPSKFSVTDKARISCIEYWEGHDKIGYIVAKLTCNSLINMNKQLIDCGCEAATYSEYVPHITIAKNIGDFDISLSQSVNAMNYHLKNSNYFLDIQSISYQDLKE